MEKKITKVKVYTIKLTEFDDNTINLERTNDGFSSLELLGICSHTSLDIVKQASGEFKPDFIKRNCIIDEVPENQLENTFSEIACISFGSYLLKEGYYPIRGANEIKWIKDKCEMLTTKQLYKKFKEI